MEEDKRTPAPEAPAADEKQQGTAPRAKAPAGLPAGSALGGYTVQRLLGKGAFGMTYLARDTTLQSLVAIKEYFPQDFARRGEDGQVRPASAQQTAFFEAGRKAFLEEARTLARFKHPHIVRILSFFEANNTAYFAMEYERGQSLKALLKHRGTLTPQEVLQLIDPLLGGLEKLHEQDIIHRDIKPGNIYLRQNGEPVLLDFGAACQRMGESGLFCAVVTKGYAPPEQYSETLEGQGPWTDIYALAAVALRCLSGTLPADSQDRIAADGKGWVDPVQVEVNALAESIPKSLLTVLRQGMALDPDARLRSVRDWRQIYDEILQTEVAGDAPCATEQTAPLRMLLATALKENSDADIQMLRRCHPVEPTTVTHGEEALEQLRAHAPDGCIVDLLLEDMSGLELLRQRRSIAALAAMPVCLAGDGLTHEHILEAIGLGACAVLPRPGNVEAMRQVLTQMASLRESHAREAALVQQARAALQANQASEALHILDAWTPLAVKADGLQPAAAGNGGSAPIPMPVAIRGPALFLFSQGCRALVQQRLEEAALALAISRKTTVIEGEARMAMADANRMAGKLDAFAAHAHEAHVAHKLLETMDTVASSLAEVLVFEEKRPLPLNTAGVQLRRQQALPAAELALSLALELAPFDPRVHFNVAKTLAHGGKHKDAFAAIQRALKLDPEFEEAEMLYRKITGKAWRTSGTQRKARSLSGLYQPLLDI